MFNCLRSERGKELHRLADSGDYAGLLYQCGYDRIKVFSDVVGILAESENYLRLARPLACDTTGIAREIIGTRIRLPSNWSANLPYRLKREFFALGVDADASEKGISALRQQLAEQQFYDSRVCDEIAKQRGAQLREEGLGLVADSIATTVNATKVKGAYVTRRTDDLDQKISATQIEAVSAMNGQLAAPNYLELLKQKRNELKAPYEETIKGLPDAFDHDVKTALAHIRRGNAGKAYELLAELGHEAIPQIGTGIDAVRRTASPPSLYGEILQYVEVERCHLRNARADVFYRPLAREGSFAVLMTRPNGNVLFLETYVKPNQLAVMCNGVFAELEHWDDSKKSTNYLPMKKVRARLIADAMTREHRA